MLKIVSRILVAFFLMIHLSLSAQDNKPMSYRNGLYEYYIYLTGVSKKSDVVKIQDKIRLHEEVSYFAADRFPVRYFKLVTAKKITRERFNKWLDDSMYKIDFFEYGIEKKENAIIHFNQLNKNAGK